MFANLRFKMVNSIGTRVAVNLYNEDDLIGYEILFPELGAESSQRKSLGRKRSEKFLHKLERNGFFHMILELGPALPLQKGDFWSLYIEDENGRVIDLNGPEPSDSMIGPAIQDIAEFLDEQFEITHYIRDDRIDRLEIDFLFNELDPALGEILNCYDECDHTESVVLDRATKKLSYNKRFPASCFHSTYECKCENQVRHILDQSSELFTGDRVFEDVMDSAIAPLLFFRLTFHDGQETCIRRSLSRRGLRDPLFAELLNAISETLMNLVFKQSLFDQRFLLQEGMSKPFSIHYHDDGSE